MTRVERDPLKIFQKKFNSGVMGKSMRVNFLPHGKRHSSRVHNLVPRVTRILGTRLTSGLDRFRSLTDMSNFLSAVSISKGY